MQHASREPSCNCRPWLLWLLPIFWSTAHDSCIVLSPSTRSTALFAAGMKFMLALQFGGCSGTKKRLQLSPSNPAEHSGGECTAPLEVLLQRLQPAVLMQMVASCWAPCCCSCMDNMHARLADDAAEPKSALSGILSNMSNLLAGQTCNLETRWVQEPTS